MSLNFEPNRWPVGDPITGYLNTDGSPTKTVILNERRRLGKSEFWDWNFGKRPAEELYNIREDPWCINNLAANSEFAAKKLALKTLLIGVLPRLITLFSQLNSVALHNQYFHQQIANYIEQYRHLSEIGHFSIVL